MSNTLFANNLDYVTTSRRERITGLKFPMPVSPGDGGFFSKSMDKAVVAQNLKQLLLTSKGERLMYPSFGTNLRAALFEPITGTLIGDLEKDIFSSFDKLGGSIQIIADKQDKVYEGHMGEFHIRSKNRSPSK